MVGLLCSRNITAVEYATAIIQKNGEWACMNGWATFDPDKVGGRLRLPWLTVPCLACGREGRPVLQVARARPKCAHAQLRQAKALHAAVQQTELCMAARCWPTPRQLMTRLHRARMWARCAGWSSQVSRVGWGCGALLPVPGIEPQGSGGKWLAAWPVAAGMVHCQPAST